MSNKKTDKPSDAKGKTEGNAIVKNTAKNTAKNAVKKPEKNSSKAIGLKEFEAKKTTDKKTGAAPSDKLAVKKTKRTQKEKRPAAMGTVLLASIIAALVGAGLGVGIMQYLDRSDHRLDDLRAELLQTQTQFQTQKTLSKTDYAALEKRFKTLQTRARKSEGNRSTAQTEIENLKMEIISLQEASLAAEKRVNDLPDYMGQIDALKKDLTALGTLKIKDGEGGIDLSALISRIDGLESGLEKGVDMTALEARLEVLEEAQIVPGFPKADMAPIDMPNEETAPSKEDVLAVLIAEFPKEKMLEAVNAQETLAAKKPSWLQRVLSKHVKVRKDDAPDPRKSINAAAQALEDGNVSEALSLVSKLNPPVKSVAAQWREAAKKAVKNFDF